MQGLGHYSQIQSAVCFDKASFIVTVTSTYMATFAIAELNTVAQTLYGPQSLKYILSSPLQ